MGDILHDAWMRKRRRSNVERYQRIKLERGCADCGYSDNPVLLGFHHLPGATKLFEIGQRPLSRWEVLEAEIAKCEVLCARCHSLRHEHMGPEFPRWRGGRPGGARDPQTGRLVPNG